ncbi:MAG: DNA-binding protein [Flammeovirgaceae bacterium TMED32]|nr:MAG: DNA-binding protein [Flammeovirgaceae bacterium TMED32]|tara:strand:+ start:71 stop:403 length:333 start_codon:yes stop_codon:yes gene_type:complete
MLDMMKMMGKVKEVQEKMKIAKEELDNLFVESDSGAGLVTARFNGNKELLELKIDNSLYGKEDKELQKDLIIAAVNKGIKAAEHQSKEHLQKATQGILPNIPGMDLNSMI